MLQKYYKKLHSIEELMAFFAASLEYNHSVQIKARGKFRQFIRENKSLWVSLGHVYGKKKPIEKAYYAFICEKLCINNPGEYDEMTKIMLEYALEPSIYCRENALKALYAFGNIDAVVEVIIKLSRNNNIHHRKLVTDGLLEFKGDHTALAESLYDHFDKFNPEYQVAIIDFFRFSGEQLKNKLIKLLKQEDTDKDIVCAILRYYQKYPVLEYKDTILSYLKLPNNEDWECVSTAALVLVKYPGEDTIDALKSVLSSKYWYVRLNAARSIAELGVEEDELLDILQGQDFYAKEQLIYHITNRKEKRLQNG
ncbi:HEAT repeat domain-containing protein [Litchfieldia salsa]|nr:HEAT repeat domain-containing protein [Litchfieldia salsa]